MIMKPNISELNWIEEHSASDTEKLHDGLYMISATKDPKDVQQLADSSESDYIMVGMVVPAKKGAAICQLLQSENGEMKSPVVLLRKAKPGEPEQDRTFSRTPEPSQASEIERCGIKIIPGRHEVQVNEKKVDLTFSEFRILEILATRPGWVYSRDKIIHYVHGDDYNCTERAVDVQVTGLRKKLGSSGKCIQTVRGVGYRFIDL